MFKNDIEKRVEEKGRRGVGRVEGRKKRRFFLCVEV